MARSERSFVPAAGVDFLLPFYDPIQWILGGERARRTLLEHADLEPGQRVLDVGCGTGSLVVLTKRLHPDVDVTGLDPDPRALARARRKLDRARLSVALDQGFADALPYPDASFDRVFSSFMFHHLDLETKRGMLREVRRVLRPEGGELLLLDFGGPDARPDGLLAHLLHSGDHLRDNFGGRIPALMDQAGLSGAREVDHRGTLLGRIASYRAASLASAREAAR